MNVNNKIKDTSVLSDNDIECIVDEKFYYSGYSARWMFQYSISEVENEAKEKIREIIDFKTLLKGLNGDRSSVAVNHLFSSTFSNDNNSVVTLIISEYVSRLLCEKCDISFIIEATIKCRTLQNPSFDGWILEMDVLHHIKNNLISGRLKLISINDNNIDDAFDNSFICFLSVPFDNIILSKDYKINTWFIPEKYNQGGYDAVQLLSENTLRFIQITRAKRHELKLSHMNKFINNFNESQLNNNNNKIITNIEIVMIYPTELIDSFQQLTAKNITGNLSKFGWNLNLLKYAIYRRVEVI